MASPTLAKICFLWGVTIALAVGGCALLAHAQTISGGASGTTPAQVQAAIKQSAPVTSVNGGQGAVTVPTVQRQVSAALDATQNKGAVSWTFPVAFTNMPTCWPSLSSSNASYSFDYPTTVTISKTAVTEQVVAHLNTLAITSLTLPISLPIAVSPPAGTTITLSCVGALP